MSGNVSRLGNIFPDVAIKAACRAASTAAITLSGLQTVDTVALAEGDRVLVKNQADQKQNGIYQATAGPWIRTADASKNTDFIYGTAVLVTSGTQDNAGKVFYQTTNTAPIAIGETNIAFTPLPSPIIELGPLDELAGYVIRIATVAAVKLLDTTQVQTIWLSEAGREGMFRWQSGDYSAHVAADSNNGVYIKADSIAASAGCWVRQFDFVTYKSRWFGTVNDHTTNNSTIINSIIAVADLPNTLTTPGRQRSAYIEIEGGVRFASSSLSFLPISDDVFVYLRYLANSDTTKGVPDGGGGTNEMHLLSVNSGYPGDVTGGMVAEWSFDAPLHPGIMINVAKQVSGADAHFGANQVRIPTGVSPARASWNIKDENVLRMRGVYEGWGSGATIQASIFMLQPFLLVVSVNNVGSNGWTGIPANGTLITGVISGAKGVKRAHTTLSLDMYWISGQFLPGEQVTDGVTTSQNAIGGGGVSYQHSSNPFLGFGINNPVVTYGVQVDKAITGFDIGARLTLRKSTGSSGGANHKETVNNAALLFTNTGDAVPTTGRQIILDANNNLVALDGVAAGAGGGGGLVGGTFCLCSFNNTPAFTGSKRFNASAVAYLGTGQYRVSFTNAAPDTDYQAFAQRTNQADNPAMGTKNTAFVVILNYNGAGALADLVGTIDLEVKRTG